MEELRKLLKEIGKIGEDWNELTEEERGNRLDDLCQRSRLLMEEEERESKKPVELTEEEETALARLTVSHMLLTSFLKDSMPIPQNMIEFYNKQLQTFYGISDDTIAFAAQMFEDHVDQFEETARDAVRKSLKEYNEGTVGKEE